MGGHPYEQGFDLRIVPERLADPLRWSKPKSIFDNSMSDLFQDGVPDAYVVQVARVMQIARWHTYQRSQHFLKRFVAGVLGHRRFAVVIGGM